VLTRLDNLGSGAFEIGQRFLAGPDDGNVPRAMGIGVSEYREDQIAAICLRLGFTPTGYFVPTLLPRFGAGQPLGLGVG